MGRPKTITAVFAFLVIVWTISCPIAKFVALSATAVCHGLLASLVPLIDRKLAAGAPIMKKLVVKVKLVLCLTVLPAVMSIDFIVNGFDKIFNDFRIRNVRTNIDVATRKILFDAVLFRLKVLIWSTT